MMRWLLGCLMMLALIPSSLQAATLSWDNRFHQMTASHHVEYWRDENGEAGIDYVSQLPDAAWSQNPGAEVNLGYTDAIYWFRTRIRNDSPGSASLFLEIAYPVIDYVDAFVFSPQGLTGVYRMGDKYPFFERPVQHRNFVIPLDMDSSEVISVFLRVDTTSSMQVPLNLWRPDAFFAAEQSRLLFEGIYYGIVLVMVLYNLFVFFAVGERSFLYYVGFIAAMPLFLASLHGLSFQYLWPRAVWWNDQSIIFFLNAVVLFGLLFTTRFISVTPQQHPVMNRLLLALTLLGGIGVVCALFVPYKHMILPTILVAAATCVVALVVSVVRLLRGDVAARYFTTAWVFMLLGGILLALSKFAALPRNLFTENATQVGSALGVILLSIALADRLNREKRAAYEAQQKLFREERKARMAQEKSLRMQQEANALLEQRVEERTRDLAVLNERLLELNATDNLTGLKNRAHFDKVFSSACVKAYRFGQPLSLLVLDIDHFKKFNDTYGHLVGDDCLQMVAQCIKQFVTRPQDVAARYGGEEFVIVLPDTPEEGAVRVAERIRREIEHTEFQVADDVLRLTVSVGVVSVVPQAADETKAIFKRADEALYEAKGGGRNQVVVSRVADGQVALQPLSS